MLQLKGMMSHLNLTRRTAVQSLLVSALRGMPQGQGADGLPGLVSEAVAEDPEQELELKASALSRDAAKFWAVLGSRPKGRLSGPQSLWLRWWDSAGREKASLSLDPHVRMPDPKPSRSTVDAMTTVADGRVFLAFAQPGNEILLLGVDPAGTRVVFRQLLAFKGEGTSVSALIPTDQGLLLSGALNLQGWMALVALDGNVLWQRILEGRVRTLWDASVANRGFVFTGSNSGGSEIWLGETDTSGKLRAEVWFPGRFAEVSAGARGGYGVVYERAGATAGDVIFRSVNPSWQVGEERVLISGLPVVTRFKIVPAPSGGHIVAGARDKRLWVAAIDSAGTPAWTHSRAPVQPDLAMYASVDLNHVGAEIGLAATVFKVVGGREQRQIVRLLRFRAG